MPQPLSSPPDFLVNLLRRRLTRLSYLALLLVVERVLLEAGYEEVRFLGRRHLNGRTRSGGADLIASVRSGVGKHSILIQVKRYDRPVSRRFVDELRGVLLRKGTPEGLLVTTSTFSKLAGEATFRYPGRPIRLIDGEHLARLMIDAGLGVTQTQNLSTGRKAHVIDEPAFREVERMGEGMRTRN